MKLYTDVDDYGDFCREMKEHRREAKQRQHSHRPRVIETLKTSGLEYQEFTSEHFRIIGLIDWWPSTGYWKWLDGRGSGHGVRPLIREAKKYLRENKDE